MSQTDQAWVVPLKSRKPRSSTIPLKPRGKKSRNGSLQQDERITNLCKEINEALKEEGITDKNRHVKYSFFTSITGQKNMPEKHIDIFLGLKTNIISLIKTMSDFETTNLSSMLSGARGRVGEAITALVKGEEALKNFVGDRKIFSAKNLSSMLSGAGVGIGKAITALVKEEEALKNLVGEGKIFSAKNLSSMLSGAGARIGETIEAFVKGEEALKNLVGDGKTFSAQNLSSMLNGAGARIGEAIEAFVKGEEALKNLVGEGKTFSAENLSSMLSGAGGRIGEAIQFLTSLFNYIEENPQRALMLKNNPAIKKRVISAYEKRYLAFNSVAISSVREVTEVTPSHSERMLDDEAGSQEYYSSGPSLGQLSFPSTLGPNMELDNASLDLTSEAQSVESISSSLSFTNADPTTLPYPSYGFEESHPDEFYRFWESIFVGS